METIYWHKQDAEHPLFPGLLWSRPEHRRAAGKLLIIGGNVHGFAAPAEAYAQAVRAGIGTARVLLPDATRKIIGPLIENGEFAPSTPSGSFSRQALAESLAQATWADGVVVAGDLGRNSETAVMLEQFIQKYHGPLTITRDAADYFKNAPQEILTRTQTTLVLSLAQLQKQSTAVRWPHALALGMDLIQLVEQLHELTLSYPAAIVTKQHDQLLAACSGRVSSTKLKMDVPVWRVRTAAIAAVWWLQNPAKPFEALTTAISGVNVIR